MLPENLIAPSYTPDERLRILNIEGALIGGWSTETVTYFFHGTKECGEVGLCWIGPKNMPIADIQYRVFLKEGDPYIELINESDPIELKRRKNYKIRLIDSRTGELTLESRENQIIELHRG